jgi:SHS2 domain-containing protein
MQANARNRGFQEIPHTADWAMKVWAEDLPGLFAEAAVGMNALEGVRLSNDRGIRRLFEDQADDAESLLVAFLSELVYLQEQENIGFVEFDVRLEGRQLSVKMQGATLAAIEKPIKAVTFNDMKISATTSGYEVQVVFDV